MPYECQAIERPSQLTLSIRTTGSMEALPQVLGSAYGALAQYLNELGEEHVGPPFVAYYNMDMQNADIEIGFPVSRRLPDHGQIRASEIPAGKVALCVHTGPYGDIVPAYDALAHWTEEHGYEPTGVAYEMYLNDPAETPAEQLQTQIVFALK